MADRLTPNYLVVNPDGTVSANFTGIVNAQGIKITPGAGGVINFPNSITWQRSADGAMVARVVAEEYTYNGDPEQTATLQAIAPGTPPGQLLNGGSIVTNASRGVPQYNYVQASAFDSNGNGQNAVIIDAAGQSSFLRLDQLRVSACGTGTLDWPGGSTRSNTLNFEPLAVYPVGFIATCTYLSDNGYPAAIAWSAYGSGINVYAITVDQHLPAAGVQCGFSWLAWA